MDEIIAQNGEIQSLLMSSWYIKDLPLCFKQNRSVTTVKVREKTLNFTSLNYQLDKISLAHISTSFTAVPDMLPGHTLILM